MSKQFIEQRNATKRLEYHFIPARNWPPIKLTIIIGDICSGANSSNWCGKRIDKKSTMRASVLQFLVNYGMQNSLYDPTILTALREATPWETTTVQDNGTNFNAPLTAAPVYNVRKWKELTPSCIGELDKWLWPRRLKQTCALHMGDQCSSPAHIPIAITPTCICTAELRSKRELKDYSPLGHGQ